jgi:hypothetical protein
MRSRGPAAPRKRTTEGAAMRQGKARGPVTHAKGDAEQRRLWPRATAARISARSASLQLASGSRSVEGVEEAAGSCSGGKRDAVSLGAGPEATAVAPEGPSDSSVADAIFAATNVVVSERGQ